MQIVDDVGDEGDDDEEDEDNQEDDDVALHGCCSLCARDESGVVGSDCDEELGIVVVVRWSERGGAGCAGSALARVARVCSSA